MPPFPDFIVLHAGRHNIELRAKLQAKLREYRDRRERFRASRWNQNINTEDYFWWIDVNVKIDLLEYLLTNPGVKVAISDLQACYRRDPERDFWPRVTCGPHNAVTNAYEIIFQYVSGLRSLEVQVFEPAPPVIPHLPSV